MRVNQSWWSLLVTSCVATSATYAATSPQACTTIADDAQRLACYDSAFGHTSAAEVATPSRAAASAAGSGAAAAANATPEATSAAAVSPAAQATAASTPRVEATDDFGLTQQAQRDRAGIVAVESISAQVTQVDRNAADRLVVTLDNGQVWVQSESTSRIRVKPGDAITIKRAALGSFMLVTAQDRSTRAKRLK